MKIMDVEDVQVVKKDPRFSVNVFAEYNHANASNREKTIIKHKYPKKGKGFGKYRNKLISYEIHEFICTRNPNLLKDALVKVGDREEDKDWKVSDNKNCIETVEVLSLTDFSIFDKFTLENNSANSDQKQDYQGLEVSILPRILIYREDVLVGGIVTRLTKGSLSKEAREDVALMLYEYLSSKPKGTSVLKKFCFSIHVPSWTVTQCPNAYVRRLEALEASARNVVLQWAAL